MSATPAPITECESCASRDVPTELVRRVYLDPAAPDDLESATIDDDVEAWCASCAANYPHLTEPAAG